MSPKALLECMLRLWGSIMCADPFVSSPNKKEKRGPHQRVQRHTVADRLLFRPSLWSHIEHTIFHTYIFEEPTLYWQSYYLSQSIRERYSRAYTSTSNAVRKLIVHIHWCRVDFTKYHKGYCHRASSVVFFTSTSLNLRQTIVPLPAMGSWTWIKNLTNLSLFLRSESMQSWMLVSPWFV